MTVTAISSLPTVDAGVTTITKGFAEALTVTPGTQAWVPPRRGGEGNGVQGWQEIRAWLCHGVQRPGRRDRPGGDFPK